MGAAGVDAEFERNYTGARAAGVLCAFYALYRPDSEGIPQAAHFVQTVGAKSYEFLAIDVEKVFDIDLAFYAANKVAITRQLAEMVGEVKRLTGAFPLIYSSGYWWNNYVTPEHDALFAQCGLWIAQYQVGKPTLPRCWSSYWLHQFTSEGRVSGIEGDVDLSRKPVDANEEAVFTLRRPVDPPVNINARNLFGANPERYAQFGLSGHDGLDYSLALNAPVYAARDGVVKLIAPDDGVHPYGSHVRIISKVGAETYEHIYAHLNKFVVGYKQGDSVKAGQQIGYAGATGNADGVHLHFAVKWLGATERGFRQKLADGRELVFEKDLVSPALFLKD